MRSSYKGVSIKKTQDEVIPGPSPGVLLREVASDIEGKP